MRRDSCVESPSLLRTWKNGIERSSSPAYFNISTRACYSGDERGEETDQESAARRLRKRERDVARERLRRGGLRGGLRGAELRKAPELSI